MENTRKWRDGDGKGGISQEVNIPIKLHQLLIKVPNGCPEVTQPGR
jgi:hypothetical protein